MPPTSRIPTIRRRRFLEGGVTALLVGLAGCNGGGGGSEPKDPVAYVSVNASLLVGVDMAVAQDEATRQILKAYADKDEETLIEAFENRTGLSASNVDRVLAFSKNPHPDRPTLLVEGGWDEQEVVASLESAHETTYESKGGETGTVYAPADDTGTNPSLGVGAEGQYLIGTAANVRTALDVAGGSKDGLAGPLRTAYTDARSSETKGTKYVSVATDQPRAYLPEEDNQQLPPGTSLDLFKKVETANGIYFVNDGTIGIDLELRMNAEDVAKEVEDFSTTILAFLRNAQEDAVAAEFSKVALSRDGTTVTVSYRTDVEGAVTLATWL